MISALNLIWIIPTCVFVGMLITAFMHSATTPEVLVKEIPKYCTLGNLYESVFNAEFEVFKEKTSGIIVVEQDDNQLVFVPYLDFVELKDYFDYKLVDMTQYPKTLSIVIKRNIL